MKKTTKNEIMEQKQEVALDGAMENLLVSSSSKVESKEYESASGEVATKYQIHLAMPLKSGLAVVECSDVAVAHNVEYIQALDDTIETAELAKCLFLAQAKRELFYKVLGFENMADFGKHVFGYERVAVLQYTRIGELFIDGTMEQPRIWACIPTGYGKSHLQEIVSSLPTELLDDIEANKVELRSIVEQLVNDSVLVSGMSCMAIRKALKNARDTVSENGERQYNLKEQTAKKSSKKSSKGEELDEEEEVTTIDNAVKARVVALSCRDSLERAKSVIEDLGAVYMAKLAEILTSLDEIASALDNEE